MNNILNYQEAGPLGASFQNDLYDDFYIDSHAKHNCRRCHGKGKLKFDNPGTGHQWTTICECVFRSLKRGYAASASFSKRI